MVVYVHAPLTQKYNRDLHTLQCTLMPSTNAIMYTIGKFPMSFNFL
jgi:hypothetical protein